MRAYTLGQGHEVTSISPIHRRRESGYRSDPPRRRLRREERRRAKNPGSSSCALQGPSSSPSASMVPVSFFFASKILLVMESTTIQHWWAFASPAFLFGLASPIQGSGANGRCLTSLQGAAGGISSATTFFFAFLVMEGFTSVLLNDHERLPSSGERPSLTIHIRVLKLPQVRTR